MKKGELNSLAIGSVKNIGVTLIFIGPNFALYQIIRFVQNAELRRRYTEEEIVRDTVTKRHIIEAIQEHASMQVKNTAL